MTTASEQIIREKDLVTRRIAGETIIVPVRSGIGDLNSIYTLNEPGSLIWGLIEQRAQFGQIVEALCSEYEVTFEEAARDLTEFLESLKAASLIRLYQEGSC
jgi:hypothetical protein